MPLVSNGTQVKIYVNGVESISNTAITSEEFSIIDIGRYGRSYPNRYTNLEMDEVCIWNRPLTMDEIRQWRHLTKPDTSDPISTGLVAYYQFNESVGNFSINKTTNLNTILYKGTTVSNRIASNAPVFKGTSQKINVNYAGLKDFDTTGLSMTFADGTYPNGDIWVSKSYTNPDVLPDSAENFDSYIIINNYGENQTFTPLESMSFTDNSEYVVTNANYYNLYKRGSDDFGNSWGEKIDTGDTISGESGTSTVVVSFSTGLNINSFSQFVLSNENTSLSVNNNFKEEENIPIIYPNPLPKGNILSINLPLEWNSSTIIIYNAMGQKINEASLKNGKKNLMKLNIPSGIYHIVIFNSERKYIRKLILN